jgi:hypothetical protein
MVRMHPTIAISDYGSEIRTPVEMYRSPQAKATDFLGGFPKGCPVPMASNG